MAGKASEPAAGGPARTVALHDSEERFRLLVTAVEDYAIFMLDPDGKVASWNLGAERIKGWREDEILGRDFALFYPEEERQAGKPARDLQLAARDGVLHQEGRRVRKDGSLFWAETTLTRLTDASGQLTGFAKVTRDVSEQRAKDEAIRRLNRELEEQIAERTHALEAATRANKEIESFSYSVSHDLRAPLRAIDGFSKLVLEQYGDRLDDEGRRFLARVRAGSQRMSRLIDDLLQLSRLSQAPLNAGPVDLAALAQETAQELARRDPERRVVFELEASLPAQGDPHLLRIAMENLLGNAWKFTSHTPNARIAFGAEEGSGETVYFVRDNGAGFDMSYADKLFLPFQRLHDPGEFEGSGIGLATAQRIIRRHGGRIWAEASPGHGATFRFTLSERS